MYPKRICRIKQVQAKTEFLKLFTKVLCLGLLIVISMMTGGIGKKKQPRKYTKKTKLCIVVSLTMNLHVNGISLFTIGY